MKDNKKDLIDLQEKINELESKNKKLNELNKCLLRELESELKKKNFYRKKARFAYA